MSGAGDVRAGGAYVELFAKDSSLQKGLSAAQARLRAFGSSFSQVGSKIAGISAAAFAPLAAAGGMFISVGDSLDDLSQKTSIGVESLSALRYVAELTGTSLEDVAKGLLKAQKTVDAAANGNKKAAATLAELGLNAKDLIDLAPEELFTRLADAVSKIENPNQRAATAMAVFGKGAASMGELLAKGGPEIERLTEQAKKLGLVMSGEEAAAAAELKDVLYGLGQQVAFLVGSGFAEWIREGTKWLSDMAVVVARIFKQNKELVTSIASVIAIGFALGAVLVTLGVLFSSAAAVIGGIMGTLSAIGAAFGVVSGAIGFLMSPIGIVVAGVAALVVWFLRCTEQGQAMIASLIAAWQEFAGEAMTSWGAIVEAIRAGDIEAAWRVVTSFLNLEWVKLTAFLQTSWAKWKGYFLSIWNGVTTALANGWETAVATMAVAVQNVWDGLQIGWVETIAFLKQGWIGFTQIVRKVWNSVSSWIGETLAGVLESVGLVEEGTAAAVKQMGQDKGKEIDQQANDSSASVETDRAKARQEIAKTSNAIQEGLAQDHAKRMNEIQTAQQAEEERIKGQTNSVIEEQEKRVQDARKAWEGAVKAATDAGKETDKELLSPNTTPAAAMKASKGAAGMADMGKVESRGTFNAMALQALAVGGGGSVSQKQLDEAKKQTEEQKKQTKALMQIADNTEDMDGLAFE